LQPTGNVHPLSHGILDGQWIGFVKCALCANAVQSITYPDRHSPAERLNPILISLLCNPRITVSRSSPFAMRTAATPEIEKLQIRAAMRLRRLPIRI